MRLTHIRGSTEEHFDPDLSTSPSLPHSLAYPSTPLPYSNRKLRFTNVIPGIFFFLVVISVTIYVFATVGNLAALSHPPNNGLNNGTTDHPYYDDTLMMNLRLERVIQDGKSNDDIEIHQSIDGEYGNPMTYPPRSCMMPNYVSRGNRIFMEYDDDSSTPLSIKGINWFGMETAHGTPLGLWNNGKNGTTVYEIATFLAKNKFNSVRLPLCITSIVNNIIPQADFIHHSSNRAIVTDSYMDLLSSLIEALGYRNISVLLDFHTLSPTEVGSLWYSPAVPENMVLHAIQVVTRTLCKPQYWNVIGLDLKNEPHGAVWGGTNKAIDFKAAVERMGNAMLNHCPTWLAFVEGVYTHHTTVIQGQEVSYNDWWGGGLQLAGKQPPVLSTPHKIVYAPHYYNPSVYPSAFYYDKSGDELNNDRLQARIVGTMDHMFGYLTSPSSSSAAVVLGEFGGLYTNDAHPRRTTRRSIE